MFPVEHPRRARRASTLRHRDRAPQCTAAVNKKRQSTPSATASIVRTRDVPRETSLNRLAEPPTPGRSGRPSIPSTEPASQNVRRAEWSTHVSRETLPPQSAPDATIGLTPDNHLRGVPVLLTPPGTPQTATARAAPDRTLGMAHAERFVSRGTAAHGRTELRCCADSTSSAFCCRPRRTPLHTRMIKPIWGIPEIVCDPRCT